MARPPVVSPQRRWREGQAARGFCVNCTKPAAKEAAEFLWPLCTEHLATRRQRLSKRRGPCICPECHEVVKKPRGSCQRVHPACRVKRLKRYIQSPRGKAARIRAAMAYQQRHREAGLCILCPKPSSIHSVLYCPKHAAYYRGPAPQCGECGKPIPEDQRMQGRKYHPACRERRQRMSE